MFSVSIDHMLAQLGAEELVEGERIFNFSEYFFDTGFLSPLSQEHRILLQHLFIEYAVFGSTGESAAFDLTEDIVKHGINIEEVLDAEDQSLMDVLESHIVSIRRSIDKQTDIEHQDGSIVTVVSEWLFGLGNPVAKVTHFHLD